MRRLAALALFSVPAAQAQSGPGPLCGADGSCPSGQFCNFADDRVQKRNSPSCESCGGGPTHHYDGSEAGPCETNLPPRGFTECQNVCGGTVKTGANGCCCGTFMGTEVQSASACAGAQMCADTDLGCCPPVFSSNGVCDEGVCVNGSGTTGHCNPGWDAYDCRPGVRTHTTSSLVVLRLLSLTGRLLAIIRRPATQTTQT